MFNQISTIWANYSIHSPDPIGQQQQQQQQQQDEAEDSEADGDGGSERETVENGAKGAKKESMTRIPAVWSPRK